VKLPVHAQRAKRKNPMLCTPPSASLNRVLTKLKSEALGIGLKNGGSSFQVARKDKAMWNQLTNREKQIAKLLLHGCDNEEIAEQTGITRRTVRAHFSKMFLRLQISGTMKRVKLATLLYQSDKSGDPTGLLSNP
jgi:DNA-binding NarL/FixJ family response regulator